MANKRKKGLRLIGAYTPKQQVAAIQKLAKKRGITAAKLLREIMRAELERVGAGSKPSRPPGETDCSGSTVVITIGPGLIIHAIIEEAQDR